MDEAKMKRRKDKRQALIETIGTCEKEREALVQDLTRLFNAPEACLLSYYVDFSAQREFLITCIRLKMKVLRYHCLCEMDGDHRPHFHFIVSSANKRGSKKPTTYLTRKSQASIPNGNRKKYIHGKQIKSKSQLVDLILSILTENTVCLSKTPCKRTEQPVPTIFYSPQVVSLFRRQFLYPALPSYHLARKTEEKQSQPTDDFKDKNTKDIFEIAYN